MRWIVAAVAAAVAYVVTENAAVAFVALVGVGFAARFWWNAEGSVPERSFRHSPVSRWRGEVTETPTGTEVTCKFANDRLQVWTSVKTRRQYEVRPEDGPPGARKGDRGHVLVTPRGYRIEPQRDERQRSELPGDERPGHEMKGTERERPAIGRASRRS